ncbi:hypothetical protein ACVGVM_19305 [Pseudonocardia bannensis]|uniref:Uncharacterized protein n=1 Tax=Pseudonocardia bannensis TaxID=630973 RepID=A0A848DJ01_9PSEU|nr:hypothetical protein [Pseudonocardia bannensis]NMH92677.1 hypothetical protein [Pseudonocardia bannensis]
MAGWPNLDEAGRLPQTERDGAAPPGDVVAAADRVRPTVPQVQHAHGLMALARSELSRRLPDVLDVLLAHGATELPLRNRFPRPRRALPRSTRPAPTS